MGRHAQAGQSRPQQGLMHQLALLRRDMGPGPFWVIVALVVALLASAVVFLAAAMPTSSRSSTQGAPSDSVRSSPDTPYFHTLEGRIGDAAFVSSNQQVFLEAGQDACRRGQSSTAPMLAVAYQISMQRPVLIQRWKSHYDTTRFTDAIAVVQSAWDELCP